ncbi:MAG: DUF7221 family queuine tRNA-ribosyltransferase-like protein [Gemmatimonadaceae bacterium]
MGLPVPGGALAEGARALGAPVLVSANAFAVRDEDRAFLRFRAPSAALSGMDVALDSAGFVAMARYGGYDWTPEQYVTQLVAAFPFTWWSSMDCCVEPEVASDRTAVRLRVAETSRMYVECRRVARDLGLSAPLPILQGRTPGDYEFAADLHPVALDWPDLIGVGSMCRRHTDGPEGLLAVVERLDQVLPSHVKLHLFGVKSDGCSALMREAAYSDRIASIDSCAWDFAARKRYPTGRTMERRVGVMREWYERQIANAGEAQSTPQLGLGLATGSSVQDRAIARLDLPFGSSGHPTDLPDLLLEEYLDLVAAGEMDAKSAALMLTHERAYGSCWGDGEDDSAHMGGTADTIEAIAA